MATIELTTADDGTTVGARPGDEIVVVLPENATTGFRWSVEEAGDVLRPVADGYRDPGPPPGDEPVFGRGGLRELRFEVTRPGIATLSLRHWQEWEGESSITQRVGFLIEVAAVD